MRKLFSLISLFLSFISLYSQDFLIKNTKQNDLWIGVQNPVEIFVKDVPCGTIVLSTDNGSVASVDYNDWYTYKCNESAFTITPKHNGRIEIDIRSVTGKDTINVGCHIFRAREIPELIGYIWDKNYGSISNNQLAYTKIISARLDYQNFPFDWDISFKVFSCNF